MVINKKSRMTFQRMKILEYLRSVRTHPSAETVFDGVKKDIPTITLATVYRNLNLLTDHGVINRLEINKEYRYDGFPDTHLHGVCQKCGSIIDIPEKNAEKRLIERAKSEGFVAVRADVTLFGVCARCA